MADKTFIEHFLDAVLGWLGRLWRTIARWGERIADWLAEWLNSNRKENTPASGAGGWPLFELTTILLYTMAALVLVTLAVFIVGLWRKRPQVEEALAVAEAAAQPDLRGEEVAADQLPSDGWIKLAQDLLDQGEPRLALRALYLASLDALAQGNWIRIKKSKSNREYERELGRRAHSRSGLLEPFGQNVLVFERVWYGLHAVSQETLEGFKANYERIRQLAG